LDRASDISFNAPVAQLDRASDYGLQGKPQNSTPFKTFPQFVNSLLTHNRGFNMFLFKRNNGFYYFYFTNPITGKRKAVTTKCKDLRGAKRFSQSYNAKDVKPINPVIYLETLETETTKYVSNNLATATAISYRYAVKSFKTIAGNKPIALYSTRDIEQYKTERIKAVSKTTCNIELRALKAVFNLAVNWNWLDVNPFKNVKLFSIPEKSPLALSSIEIETVLNVIDKPVIKSIVLFTLNTGCRINEVLNVQYKDINLLERVLTIGNKETFRTKSKRIRHIPINDSLLNLINSIIPQSNVIEINSPETYLFNKKGVPYNKNFVSKSFKRYLRIAGLPERFHFHCLRHTVITNLVKAGANIRYIQQIAGHSDLNTTERYTHIGINDLRKTINLL